MKLSEWRVWWTQRHSRHLNQPSILEDQQNRSLDHIQLGALGEKIAADFLVLNGRKILYRNYRGPYGGEIDIVARHGVFLTFVEVKTRRAGGLGRPLDAVNNKKRELMRRGARAWLKLLKKAEPPWRHDVVEVLLVHGKRPQVNIVEAVDTDPRREKSHS